MKQRKGVRPAHHFLFGHSAGAFACLSVILLVVLAIVPAKDHFREWSNYQRQYLNLIHIRGDGVPLAHRFHAGVQQIWIPTLSVVDRCPTCHAGVKEASLSDITTQPFQPHAPIPHSLTEFGCVMCHRGQGVATTVEEAHRSTKDWEEPILPMRFIEASCGQCHERPLAGTFRLNAGRDLLAGYGCTNCHAIASPEGLRMMATEHPPSLAHIAAKTTREWIFTWVRNPQAYAETARMPNFQLSEEDARDLSAFLISQSRPYVNDEAHDVRPAPDRDASASVQEGSSLYGESFCASCHAMQDASGVVAGGNIGPELSRIGSKVQRNWLAEWLRNPKMYDADAPMPHYRFSEKEIGLLMAFLESKADSRIFQDVYLEPATSAQIAHGKALANERGCASCHEINGVARTDNFAPDLSTVGSLSLAKIVFAPGMSRTLPDYLAGKIRQPRSFGNALKMPQFVFSDEQVDALVTALLGQTTQAKTLPPVLRVKAAAQSGYQAAGKAGQLMADMHCFSCHAVNGQGGDMAPDLTWEGSSVTRSWLLDFLKHPHTLRPSLIRRMPKLNLTDDEAHVLTDYIMTAYQKPAFDDGQIDAGKLNAAEAANGKNLYYGKYACQACHIIDPNKDRGYIGPTLTQVALRLNAIWILQWLKNAQALRPGTMELNWNMNDDDARAITAFLMQQKGASPGGTSK